MKDSEFLRLVTAAVQAAKPFHGASIVIDSLDTPFKEYGIDSLDMLMICIYMSEAFKVPEEVAKNMQPANAGQMKDFLFEHAPSKDLDVDAAIEAMK